MVTPIVLSYTPNVNKYKSGVLTIAGIAALFLGLAGSAHAIPFSMRDTLDSGVHWRNQNNNLNNRETALILDRTDESAPLFGLNNSYRFGINRGYDMESLRHHDWRLAAFMSHHQPAPKPKSNVLVANVPEGGATVAMIGFAIMGLAFMRKVLPI